MKKVSFIIPTWRPVISQLKECLESVINQTYKNLEIIISYRSDEEYDKEMFELIKNLNDNRIKTIKNEKPGMVNSLNQAISAAEGEYLARLDTDDFCETSRIEKQIEFLTENDLDVVGSWAYVINDESKKIGKLEVPSTFEEIRKKIMLHNPFLHSSMMIKKSIFEKVGLYDENFIHAEDYELWLRVISKGCKLGNVPECLIYLREAMNSRSRGNEWRLHRKYHIKAKNKAVFKYGFRKPRDLIYHMTTPITFFISPNFALKAKKLIGWYKE